MTVRPGTAAQPKPAKFTKDQLEILAAKKSLQEIGATKEVVPLAGEPMQEAGKNKGKSDVNTGMFAHRSAQAVIQKMSGLEAAALPDNLREALPPESQNVIYKSRSKEDVAYLVSKQKQPDGKMVTKYFAIQNKTAPAPGQPGWTAGPGTAGPRPGTTPAPGADGGAGANGSLAAMDKAKAGLGLVFKHAGVKMPSDPTDETQVKAFWKDIEEASRTPVDKKHPEQGTKLGQIANLTATVAMGDKPGVSPDQINMLGKRIELSMAAEASRQTKEGYQSWGDLNAGITKAVVESDGTPGQPTKISDPRFLDEVQKLVPTSTFANDTKITILGKDKNGTALQERLDAIKGAKSDIDIAVWKVYGDEVGDKFVDALVAKREANPEVPIRLAVDGNVAQRDPKSMELLNKLKAAGVDVQLWNDPNHPMSGMHYKGMTVDAKTNHPTAIIGGRNIGHEYLADGAWRDTDVKLEGRGALNSQQQFAQLWNGHAHTNGTRDAEVLTNEQIKNAEIDPSLKADNQVMTVVDVPGPQNKQDIAQVMIKAFRGAEKEINVEQGYFLDVPSVITALQEAAARGVKVRIFANGSESMDVAGLDLLGKAAMAQLASNPNVELFTKKSTKLESGVPANTLHSKFFSVDGTFAGVGSWNQHGRSLILEGEGMTFFKDPAAVAALNQDFIADISTDGMPKNAESLKLTADDQKTVGMLNLIGVSQL